jgi:putative hydrolase of the HAD superfamily
MINTIFFDIGGVLLNIHPERTINYLSSITNLSENDVIDSFPEDAHHKYERGEISDTEFCESFKNSLPKASGLTIKQFWHAWSLLVGEKTAVFDIMDKLTDRYSVWLLSNTNPYHILIEEKFKLFNKVKGGIYSFEIGSRKPEKEIFQKALKIANAKPELSLFIDDLEENVETARQLKFNVIHFISEENLTKQLTDIGVKV